MEDGKLVLGFMPDGTGEAYPFNEVFDHSVDITKKGFEGVDCLVLWGGEDISPTYYKQKRHSYNQSDGRPSSRDTNEWKAMLYAKANNIPILGVCRGAQFLCAFAGGTLVQHVNGHQQGDHHVMLEDGRVMATSSCHHQMMFPYKVDHRLLAWAAPRLSSVYEDENDLDIPQMKDHFEPEVVYFSRVNGLAIQGHPEWMKKDEPFVKWCNQLVLEYLIKELIEA